MDLGRNQNVVSLEVGIFQGRPKSIRPNSKTVKIRPMAQEADSTHLFRPISVHPLNISWHSRGSFENYSDVFVRFSPQRVGLLLGFVQFT